jgi:hypothetical protein
MKRRRIALVALATLVIGGAAVGGTFAAFKSQTDNPGDSVAAASDFRAPAVTAQATSKTQGGSPAYVKQGGTYYIYANVAADTGNPATGITSVTADASNLTTGQTTVAMASGSWTIGAQSYNYRTASLTANAVLAAGSKAFSVTSTDGNSNSATGNGTLTVDNTAPTASDVQATNVGGGTAGLPEAGDTLTYSFSEPIEPASILTGWSGAAQNVTIHLTNVANADTMTIFNQADTTQLPFGTIALNGNYTTADRTFPASSMTMTGNNVAIVLGTPSGATKKETGGAAMVWTPSTTPYDRAANAVAVTPATETGTADVEF